MKKYIVLISLVVVSLATISYLKYQRDQNSTIPATTPLPTQKPPEITIPISLSEIKKHNKRTDCWLEVEGSVYNMTSFIGIHPGGDAIAKGCGTNATLLFNSVPSHKQAVRDLLNTFKIGIIKL